MTDHESVETADSNGVVCWNGCHLYKVRDHRQPVLVEKPEAENLRTEIEP